MIRFIPDTWWEALLRPIAMAMPDGNVYVEIMAPDPRFALAILLAATAWAMRKRIEQSGHGVWVLFAFVAATFVPWLATSGNGRYFIAILLAVGPLCIGLVWLLPLTGAARGAIALGILALQAFVVFDTTPWRTWTHAVWREAPYFDIDVPADVAAKPATYVTIASISYSLLFPRFHPDSHWINLTALSPDPSKSSEAARAHRYFAQSPLYIFVPTVPSHTQRSGMPDAEVMDTMDRHLAAHQLRVDRTRSCRMLRSRTVAQMVLQHPETATAERLNQLGFWLCPLSYPVPYTPERQPPVSARVEAVYEKIEQSCPRFFPPNTSATARVGDGALRDYSVADMKLYVMDDGRVFYKYWRALNAQLVGTVDQVLQPSFTMDCSNIRGRSGLPWQRTM